MTELAYRTLRAEDALAEATHHLTQAAHHTKKANDAHRLYISLLPGGDNKTLPGLPDSTRRRKAPKCLMIWTDYIREHGPGIRQEIEMATDTRFNERAYPYTVEWDDSMVNAADDDFMPDALFRIRSIRLDGGRGGAPVVFFLWSQRYDLYEKYGVGPKPLADRDTEHVEPLLGVVYPETHDTVVDDDLTWDEAVDAAVDEVVDTGRFATAEEWDEHWLPLLADIIKYGDLPTDAEKEQMRATLPEGMPDAVNFLGLAPMRARSWGES